MAIVCKDQDYRKASVKNNVSNIISICDIPKTTTVDQVITRKKTALF